MKAILFQILFFLRFHRWMHQRISIRDEGVILCFHRISDHKDLMSPPLKVEVFESIISYLSKYFEICDTKNFFENSSSGKLKVLITFDDGYKDFIQNALPILKKYNAPAVHHVIVDAVNKESVVWTEELNSIINTLFTQKEFGIYTFGQMQLDIS